MGGWGDTVKPVVSGGAGGPVNRGTGGRVTSTVARSVTPSVGVRKTPDGQMAVVSRWEGREAPSWGLGTGPPSAMKGRRTGAAGPGGQGAG